MHIDVDPEQDFHVVIDGAAKALSLDALAEAYQADSIGEDTLIWQQGLNDWMPLGDLLAVLGEQEEEQEPTVSAPAVSADPNNYWVAIAPEEVKSMRLEALADAHRLGVVHDDTLVQEPGSTEWVPLAVVIAGFATRARQSLAPSQAPTPSAATAQAAPHQVAPQASTAPQPSLAPQASTAPSFAPGPAPVASSAPVAAPASVSAPSAAPLSNAAPHPSMSPSAPNTFAPTAASVAPVPTGFPQAARVPSDLDDLGFPAFQSSRSVWIKRSMIGAGALVAAFAIYSITGEESPEAAQPVAAAAPSKSVVPTVEPEAEPSAWEKEKAQLEEARRKDEAAAAEAANSPMANAFGASLAGEPKAKKPGSAPARSKAQPKAKQRTPSENTGKRQFDPMNGAL